MLSQVVDGGGRDPTTIHAAGQHLSGVLAHFRVDQLIELGIHDHEQVGVFLRVQREVVQLVRIVLQLRQQSESDADTHPDQVGGIKILDVAARVDRLIYPGIDDLHGGADV